MKNPTFTVTGNGPFPLDMLRYECAWPANPADVLLIQEQGERTVTLRTTTPGRPTTARWKSFGWIAK